VAALGVALTVAGWIFAFKMKSFLGLATTSDLYQFVQLATTWLNGAFLHDNCFGDHLSIHTYFFVPLLAVFAKPFGAPGLLFALSLAAAAMFAAIVRILRLQAQGEGGSVCALPANRMSSRISRAGLRFRPPSGGTARPRGSASRKGRRAP